MAAGKEDQGKPQSGLEEEKHSDLIEEDPGQKFSPEEEAVRGMPGSRFQACLVMTPRATRVG